ncbi:hypothetical protein G6F24_016954 [Rhizopus arrhizus]|nr:hypothetical protein G6F24_016954 [Rhizopus arrhizus]
MASLLPARMLPAATLVTFTAPVPVPVSDTLLITLPLPSTSYFTASLSISPVWSATLASELLTASKAVGAVSTPLALTAAPPPRWVATAWLAANSWAPLIASLLVALTWPGPRLRSVVAVPPWPSVALA